MEQTAKKDGRDAQSYCTTIEVAHGLGTWSFLRYIHVLVFITSVLNLHTHRGLEH